MIPDEHLRFFITEQLYVLDDRSDAAPAMEPEKMEPQPPSTPSEDSASVEALTSEIIIIYDQGNAKEMELLTKILAAVNVDVDDVLLIEGQPKQLLSFERLIVFGDVPVEETGKELYDATANKRWLRAASLRNLDASQQEKMKLWNALKTWFGVS